MLSSEADHSATSPQWVKAATLSRLGAGIARVHLVVNVIVDEFPMQLEANIDSFPVNWLLAS